HLRTQLLGVLPGGGSCQPARFAFAATQASVQTHCAFRNNKWNARRDPFIERLVQCRALFCENAGLHGNAGVLQNFEASATMSGIRISRADHYRTYPAADNLFGARTGASFGRTRLQGHVKRGIFRNFTAHAAQTFNFRVRLPRLAMVPPRENTIPTD